MDVRVLSARSEMDSRLKPMDSRIQRRLLLIRDLRCPTTPLQVLLQAKKMHAHDLNSKLPFIPPLIILDFELLLQHMLEEKLPVFLKPMGQFTLESWHWQIGILLPKLCSH